MNWFFSSGDAPFFFPEQLDALTFFPDVWRGQEGMGISSIPLLWIDYPFRLITYLLSSIGLSWFWIDKFWWILIFSLAICGIFKLAKLVGLNNKLALISSLIYTTNTYFLLLFDGGQIGVALAYSFFPWALYSAITYLRKKELVSINDTIKVSLLLGIQFFLDIRIAYIFYVILLLIIVLLWRNNAISFSKLYILIPVFIVAINWFWLFPSFQYKDSLQASLIQIDSNTIDLSFFSVADFTHSLSLLHPNYPENLFGRVYFFKSEFLLIAIIAFSILLSNNISFYVIFFCFIGIIGAFLAKGVHEPFGFVYELFFRHIPGFSLFRDPTKWYILMAVSYAVLIPQHIELLSKKNNKKKLLFIIIFISIWLFTLRLFLNGKVTGNTTPMSVTNDYSNFKTYLTNNLDIGRTLWLPQIEKVSYSDDIHPSLSASEIFSESSPAGIIRLLRDDNTVNKIESAGVSHIVVPEDLERRIFIDNYIFKEELRNNLISTLDAQPWLEKLDKFEHLRVYKTKYTKSFFTLGKINLTATPLSYDRWSVVLPARSTSELLTTLITYDPHWSLITNNYSIRPNKNDNGLMKYIIPEGKAEKVILEYTPTTSVKISSLISIISLMILIGFIILSKYIKLQDKWKSNKV